MYTLKRSSGNFPDILNYLYITPVFKNFFSLDDTTTENISEEKILGIAIDIQPDFKSHLKKQMQKG